MKGLDRLSEIFDLGSTNGIDSLSVADRELFLIQDFIIGFEMGGLSGYLYNRLPAIDVILATISAMSNHRLNELANLLQAAANLFVAYKDPNPPTTWNAILQQYDPDGLLDELNRNIGRLDNYGLDQAFSA
jgi:hypothetical protein